MIENIAGLFNISPFILAFFLLIFQIISQSRDIKNKNIISSRLTWLQDLKHDFAEYNKYLIAATEPVSDTKKPNYRKDLEEAKIKILLRFKSHPIPDISNYEKIKDLFNNCLNKRFKEIKNEDDCEKEMINLMQVANSYYIRKSNHDISDSEDEVDISFDIFLDAILQFQICLCKIEWIKINKESQIFHFKTNRYFKKETLMFVDMMKDNLNSIITSNMSQLEEDDDDSQDKKQNTTYNDKKYWDSSKTVSDNLENVLNLVDPFSRLSLKTASGKRYIFSSVEAVHPSGKRFARPKKVILKKSKKTFYLETNFSRYQGHKVAERIIREIKS